MSVCNGHGICVDNRKRHAPCRISLGDSLMMFSASCSEHTIHTASVCLGLPRSLVLDAAASRQFCTRESVLVSKRTAPFCPSAHASVASTCIAEVQPCARGCRAKNTLPAGVAVYEEATQQRREEVAPKTQKSNYFCQRRREQHTHRDTGGSVKSPCRHRQAGH